MVLFFVVQQKTSYDVRLSLVGSEICISDSPDIVPAASPASPRRVYPVDAETLETLLERYRDVYPMESYAPDGAAKTAAIVLYEQ